MTRLLYIEDEPDIREIAFLSLQVVGGFEVSTAKSGSEALQIVAQIRPEVILLDVMMPGMDGPATLRELRKLPETSGTPVIFMTAKVQEQEVAGLRKMGALDVIPKPFDPMQLADQVRSILRRNLKSPSLERIGLR